MTFASLYSLTIMEENVNLGSRLCLYQRKQECQGDGNRDAKECQGDSVRGRIWKKMYVAIHTVTYIHTTRELFHNWKKKWQLHQASHVLDKIFLEDTHLFLFSFFTYSQLIIWLPTCSASRERMCWLQPQESGGHCDSSGCFCPHTVLLVVHVFLVSLVSMGLIPWVCPVLTLLHVEVSGYEE